LLGLKEPSETSSNAERRTHPPIRWNPDPEAVPLQEF
jgi:hypothetical protein